MGVSKPFENVSCQGRIHNFFQGGNTNFRHFFKRSFFFGKVNFKQLNNQNDCTGVRGHARPENF